MKTILTTLSFLFCLNSFAQVQPCETGPGNNCVSSIYDCQFLADASSSDELQIQAEARLTLDAGVTTIVIHPDDPHSPAVWAGIETFKENEVFKGYFSINVHFIPDISKIQADGSIYNTEIFGYAAATALLGTEKISALSGKSGDVFFSLYCELAKE